jgi:alkanesulfonate monooxygenase SsuD/methylene tetrahydromethanopterin reductase-like flavin-dependent oxidoreductase (luciferase family)
LTLGVGIGSDRFGEEFSRFGDEIDDRRRAEMTDEALEILRAAWSGEPVDHRGTHYTVDQVEFLPRSVRPRGIPVWIAGFPGKVRPRRRAARHEGFFPVNLDHPDELAEAVDAVTKFRAETLDDADATDFDVAVAVEPGTDPAGFVSAGATWCLTETDPEILRLADIRAMVADGPFR